MVRFELVGSLFLSAILVFGVAVSFSQSPRLRETIDGIAAERALQDRILSPDRLRLDSDLHNAHFQFELRLTNVVSVAGESAPKLRMICESDRDHVAMLILTDRGHPYAYIGQAGIYVIASDEKRSMRHLDGVRFAWEIGVKDAQANVFINNTLDHSRCYLDVAGLTHVFISNDHTIRLSPLSNTFVVSATGGKKMIAKMSREATSYSFPIRSLSVVGNSKVDWEVTTFQLGPTIVRSILAMEPLFARNTTLIRHDEESAKPVLEALPWPDFTQFERLFSDVEVIETSERLGALWRRKWTALPATAEKVEQALDQMDEVISRSTAEDSEHLLMQINGLYSASLRSGICDRSAVLMTAQGKMWIAGRDPNRGVLHAESKLSPMLQRRLYRVLVDIVCSSRFKTECRMRALDVLGDIGLPDDHEALKRIRKCVESEESVSLKRMLATVDVRQLDFTNAQVDLLREALRDPDLPTNLSAVYLESLFLADATNGLVDEATAILQRGDLVAEMLKRCWLAMACSDDGRGMLIAELKKTDELLPPEMVLSLLATRIAPDDPRWGELLAELKRLSLERSSATPVRIAAATMAGRADGEEQFRERFIRQAIVEENMELTLCGVQYHLAELPEALVILDDARRHFKSSSRMQQLLLLGILAIRSNAPIPAGYHASLQVFLRAVAESNDPELQSIGKTIQDRLQKTTQPR